MLRAHNPPGPPRPTSSTPAPNWLRSRGTCFAGDRPGRPDVLSKIGFDRAENAPPGDPAAGARTSPGIGFDRAGTARSSWPRNRCKPSDATPGPIGFDRAGVRRATDRMATQGEGRPDIGTSPRGPGLGSIARDFPSARPLPRLPDAPGRIGFDRAPFRPTYPVRSISAPRFARPGLGSIALFPTPRPPIDPSERIGFDRAFRAIRSAVDLSKSPPSRASRPFEAADPPL